MENSADSSDLWTKPQTDVENNLDRVMKLLKEQEQLDKELKYGEESQNYE